ncbi:hypothetical protein JEQ12_019620 [Ovis aries]|uniref:Uncharacterized protein n=1 Tax=Ovis aries TaxID=9940 RepID=A0A835ZJM2_SHEEP|nr:hypothetical protein JEQ12_019620 [Ovis aries]
MEETVKTSEEKSGDLGEPQIMNGICAILVLKNSKQDNKSLGRPTPFLTFLVKGLARCFGTNMTWAPAKEKGQWQVTLAVDRREPYQKASASLALLTGPLLYPMIRDTISKVTETSTPSPSNVFQHQRGVENI